jgi:hypothetical protein
MWRLIIWVIIIGLLYYGYQHLSGSTFSAKMSSLFNTTGVVDVTK